MADFAFGTMRRLVVKIGSALLVDGDGQFDRVWLNDLASDIAGLHKAGQEVLIVSSGAVAIGCNVLGLRRQRSRLDELQAAAAAGQVQLVHAWQEALARHGITAAQVLLTPGDTEDRRRFLNARNTLQRLLELKVIPVINENDTVATDELRYGDNDRLAARVAQMVMADGLVLLSDVDGLYTGDPHTDTTAEHVPLVRDVTHEIMAMASGSGSAIGSGGMRTKLQAAKIATHAGCVTIIASGAVQRPLGSLVSGGKCTIFLAEGTPAAARKQWLAGMLSISGQLHIDDGAAEALAKGSSLLPVGLLEVSGTFVRGDAVALVSSTGVELGRGLAAYASDETMAIIGCRSEQIEAKLGYRGRSVVVHRDDLVVFQYAESRHSGGDPDAS
jgi:glutamate 5-kinase